MNISYIEYHSDIILINASSSLSVHKNLFFNLPDLNVIFTNPSQDSLDISKSESIETKTDHIETSDDNSPKIRKTLNGKNSKTDDEVIERYLG